MQKQWVILQDTRENKPLPFPEHLVVLDPDKPPQKCVSTTVKLVIKRSDLQTGDYQLEGWEKSMVVETKRGLREVAGNVFDPVRRQRLISEFARIAGGGFKRAALVWEGTLVDLSQNSLHHPHYGMIHDGLQRMLAEHLPHAHLLICPNTTLNHRRATSEWVARMLINAALTDGA